MTLSEERLFALWREHDRRGDGSRQPSQNELDGERHQGALVAKTAIKLFG